MTWTTSRPTKPGWYFYRWNHGPERVVQVLYAKGDAHLYVSDERGNLTHVDEASGVLSQWAGPIAPPDEGGGPG